MAQPQLEKEPSIIRVKRTGRIFEVLIFLVPKTSEGFISDGNIQGEEIGEAGATPELAGALEAILKLAALGFNAPEPTGPPRSAAAW